VQIPPRPGACMHANTMQAVKKARSSTHARAHADGSSSPSPCNAMHCKHPRPVPVLVFRWTAELSLSLRWRWSAGANAKGGRPAVQRCGQKTQHLVGRCAPCTNEPGQNAQYYFARGRRECVVQCFQSSPVQPPYPY
jgi:hypothetical protein